MSSKTVQLSTRVSDEDAAFLARLQIRGATTPSDKLRAIIGDARRRYEAAEDYGGAVRLFQDLLAPVRQRLREVEHDTRQHSELVAQLADWLAESLAFLVAQVPGTRSEDAVQCLRAVEAGLAERVMRLLEAMLRMGITPDGPCYDRAAISSRLQPVLELCEIISSVRARALGPQKGSEP